MKFYKLSKQRVLRVLHHPERVEVGIVPNTVACMQRTGNKQPTEIWMMYQELGEKARESGLRVITAWRYPGVSPVRDEFQIPEDVLEGLREEGILQDS